MCRQVLASDPFSGYLFVFVNRRHTAIKVLVYDGQGFWCCQKRLSEGRFSGWPPPSGHSVESLAAHELQLLLWNGDPKRVRVAPAWKRLANG